MFRKAPLTSAPFATHDKNEQKNDTNARATHQTPKMKPGKEDLHGKRVSRQIARNKLVEDGLMQMALTTYSDLDLDSDSEEMEGPPNTPKTTSVRSQNSNPKFFATETRTPKNVDQSSKLADTAHFGL